MSTTTAAEPKTNGPPQDDDFASELARLERDYQKKCAVEADAKRAHKEAKEAADSASAAVHSLIREHFAPLPLYDKAPEEWQSVPLREAWPDVAERIVALLAEEGIKTMGDWADKTKQDGWEKALPKGIGPAMIEKLEAACAAFWERRGEVPTEPEDDEAE